MSQSAPGNEFGNSSTAKDSINNHLQDTILHSVGMILGTT